MAKGIYIGITNSYINQRLANLITDEQFPVWDKTELLKYKSIYLISKAWVLLELRYFHPSRQISPSVEENFNPINNKRPQTFTCGAANVISDLSNAFGPTPSSTPLTKALLA